MRLLKNRPIMSRDRKNGVTHMEFVYWVLHPTAFHITDAAAMDPNCGPDIPDDCIHTTRARDLAIAV